MNLQLNDLRASIDRLWNDSILERLEAYIRIPNKSPLFDAQWERNGHMEAAITLMAEWCRAQPLPGMRVQVRRLPGATWTSTWPAWTRDRSRRARRRIGRRGCPSSWRRVPTSPSTSRSA